MVYLIQDLGKKPESSFYAHHLKGQMSKLLSNHWASNLDPLKYRKLYVKKVNLDASPILTQTQGGQSTPFVRQSNEDKALAKKYQELYDQQSKQYAQQLA